MLRRTLQTLVFACGVVTVLALPTESRAGCRLIDCLFGTEPGTASATTYAPPYVPAPAYVAPAAPCAPCATPCEAPCAQSCNYMAAYAPTVAYRPYVAYAPVVAAAYQPVSGSFMVSRYRPYLGTYDTRLVPYTTYRPYYTTTYAPVVGYSAAYAYAPTVGCGSCGYSSCGSCATGGCGSVVYGAAPSGCSSCTVPSVSTVTPPPAESAPKSAPPTFQQGTQRPIPDTDKKLDPIPADNTKSTSTPAPTLPDPNNRTAYRQLTGGASVHLVSQPAKPALILQDAGNDWHAPHN